MANNIPCKVCGGKGGWKTGAKDWRENSWQDCLYCDALGFVLADEVVGETAFLLAYNGYKKIITDIMESTGKIISYKTRDLAEIIEIEYLPNDKTKFVEFAKRLLKFGHYNRKLGIEIQQVFFYEPSIDKLNYYWRLSLKPDELKDLDGFVDFIRAWEK